MASLAEIDCTEHGLASCSNYVSSCVQQALCRRTHHAKPLGKQVDAMVRQVQKVLGASLAILHGGNGVIQQLQVVGWAREDKLEVVEETNCQLQQRCASKEGQTVILEVAPQDMDKLPRAIEVSPSSE